MKEIYPTVKKFQNVLYYKELYANSDLLKTIYTQLLETFNKDFESITEKDITISKEEYLELLLLKIEIKRIKFKEMLDLSLEYTKEYYKLNDEIQNLQEKIDYLKL